MAVLGRQLVCTAWRQELVTLVAVNAAATVAVRPFISVSISGSHRINHAYLHCHTSMCIVYVSISATDPCTAGARKKVTASAGRLL